MTKLIQKIVIKNVALFILLVTLVTYVAFASGYASNGDYNKEILIIYSIAAICQIGINYLIYKKHIVSNWKVLLIIVITVIAMYVLFPVISNLL
jgi:drug/metabolite transporter superfamily protein YnfA